MAQSGSYNFTVTRDNLIEDALKRVQMLGEGESASSNQLTESARLLNMIVKFRARDGMPGWALRRGYILPFSGASSINTDSHVVTNYDTTTLTADSAASDTTLTVSSITGFSNADQIGIELDNGNIDWTTVNGAPSGTTITITTGVTTAASSGNRVYGYTASSERVQKPLRIILANRLLVSDNFRTEIQVLSRDEYYDLSNPTTEAPPLGIYYTTEPSSLTALETNGQIFVYPRFSNGDYVIEFTYQRPFQDFDAATDDVDFPQGFYLPLMLELAFHVGAKTVPPEERNALWKEMLYYWDQALEGIQEEGSYKIVPNARE